MEGVAQEPVICLRHLQPEKHELGKWRALSGGPWKASKGGSTRQDPPNHRPCTQLFPGREDENHESE